MERKLAVVLLSGGLDSTTVAALCVRNGYEVHALTFSYGQRHAREIRSAVAVAEALGIRHKVVDVSFLREVAWYSALTNEALPVPRGSKTPVAGIPITYVPLRNTMFIAMGAAFLESAALDLIENKGVEPGEVAASLFIAANAIDYSGYPDCRPEYYVQISKAVTLGSKLGTAYGRPITIETPIIHKSKAEIIKLAVDAGVPLGLTWSCYEGGERPCAACDSCLLRAKGFAEAGVKDPAL